MSYKTILVYADPSAEAQGRIAVAGNIAKAFDATLVGMAASPRPFTYPFGDPVVDNEIGLEMEEKQRRINAQLKAIEASFRKAAAAPGARVEWQNEPHFAVDLIVIGRSRRDESDDFQPVDIGSVLLRSGRPLLIPSPKRPWTGAQNVLVAWKDTREARRALCDALPFLEKAKKVVVLQIRESSEPDADDLSSVKAFLDRHGVRAEVRSDPRKGAVEEQLVSRASEQGADLIVAGGYGHTRVGEWVFGGVTEALIRETPVPVLLSH